MFLEVDVYPKKENQKKLLLNISHIEAVEDYESHIRIHFKSTGIWDVSLTMGEFKRVLYQLSNPQQIPQMPSGFSMK